MYDCPHWACIIVVFTPASTPWCPAQPHLIPLVYNLSQVETRTFSQIQNNDTFDKSNLERNDVNGRAGTVPRHSDTVQLSILILLCESLVRVWSVYFEVSNTPFIFSLISGEEQRRKWSFRYVRYYKTIPADVWLMPLSTSSLLSASCDTLHSIPASDSHNGGMWWPHSASARW